MEKSRGHGSRAIPCNSSSSIYPPFRVNEDLGAIASGGDILVAVSLGTQMRGLGRKQDSHGGLVTVIIKIA